jgi:hypothetical protein
MRNEAMQHLLQVERDGDLWNRRVFGMPVWSLERLPQYRAHMIASQLGEEAAKESLVNPLRNLLSRTRTSLRDLSRGGPGARGGRDIWVLSASNYRRRDEEGRYQCALAEHLRNRLGSRLLFIERNQADLPSQERSDVIFVDAAFIGAEALGRAAGPLVARTPFGRDARKARSPVPPHRMCADGVYARLMLALGRRWVRRARPRAVFVLNGYHLFIPFQIAVREAGIPLIELQHGLIGQSHSGYVLEGAPPLQHVPDHLVVFGRHFGELLDRESPVWKGRWSVGGHPWLKEKQAGVDQLPNESFDTVALFSQNIEFARQRIRALAGEIRMGLPKDVRVVLKPHPGEIDAASYYRTAANAGVDLASSRDDTYALLRRCRVAVTVYSTVGMEALAFRCRSALVRSPLWPEDLRGFVEDGSIEAVDTADDVIRLAGLGPRAARGGDLANRYFGVREPELDFERLIERVRAGLTPRASEERWGLA